jgi:hypothetical protein
MLLRDFSKIEEAISLSAGILNGFPEDNIIGMSRKIFGPASCECIKYCFTRHKKNGTCHYLFSVPQIMAGKKKPNEGCADAKVWG